MYNSVCCWLLYRRTPDHTTGLWGCEGIWIAIVLMPMIMTNRAIAVIQYCSVDGLNPLSFYTARIKFNFENIKIYQKSFMLPSYFNFIVVVWILCQLVKQDVKFQENIIVSMLLVVCLMSNHYVSLPFLYYPAAELMMKMIMFKSSHAPV